MANSSETERLRGFGDRQTDGGTFAILESNFFFLDVDSYLGLNLMLVIQESDCNLC